MKVGGHVSIAGGFQNALTKTIEIGGNTLQMFASSPRIWTPLVIDIAIIKKFVTKKHELGINPIYFHSSYLINLADADFIGKKSKERILQELELGEKMEIKGTIIHLGSYKEIDKTIAISKEKYKILLNNISWILDRSPTESYFIIENAGSRKIGWYIEEIGTIISDIQDKRLRVCLDTCHLHAAGYDLSSKEKFLRFFTEFDKNIGIDKLEVLQINDSKDPLGSFRDRHENIGDGTIPPSVFELLANEKVTKNMPFILEVPGVEKKGPNKDQISKFKHFFNSANTSA